MLRIAAVVLFALLLWVDYRAGTRAGARFDDGFVLTDHTGTVRTRADLAGRWNLVFFGYATCPNVCPTTLGEVAEVMEGLGELAASVQPVFISIDPRHDTPGTLAKFVPRFGAGILGLTGTPEQIARNTGRFHIARERAPEPTAPRGYRLRHSAQLFLFGPDGRLVTSWPYGTPAGYILADLHERLPR